jgi:hypothetical protein
VARALHSHYWRFWIPTTTHSQKATNKKKKRAGAVFRAAQHVNKQHANKQQTSSKTAENKQPQQ